MNDFLKNMFIDQVKNFGCPCKTNSDSSQNGDGLTSTEKSLILSLFKNAANYEDFVKLLIGYRETLGEDLYFTVPDGVTSLRNYAFADMYPASTTGMVYITLPDSVEEFKGNVFSYNVMIQIGQLPSNLKKIGTNCFQYASKIFGSNTELEIPASMEEISSLAFYRYNGAVNTLTFKGTPTTIANNAFQGCSQFTTINVPWAEGAVANAPWGATNATINYSYTGA